MVKEALRVFGRNPRSHSDPSSVGYSCRGNLAEPEAGPAHGANREFQEAGLLPGVPGKDNVNKEAVARGVTIFCSNCGQRNRIPSRHAGMVFIVARSAKKSFCGCRIVNLREMAGFS
jgi:hypothetical protein